MASTQANSIAVANRNKQDQKYLMQQRVQQVGVIVLNVIMWLFMMFPLIYAVLMALKPSAELYDPNSMLFPRKPNVNKLRSLLISPL